MTRRAGLDRAAVVQAAATLADAEGFEQLTLARLAAHLEIRIPSLYNHVAGLDGLRRDLTVLGCQELGARIGHATIGKAGDDALVALALAYRAFAKEHPGLYAAAQHAPDFHDPEAQAVGQAVVEVAAAVLASYGLQGEAAIHAVRGLRSALHGFIALEAAGGFGLPLDLNESFRRLIQMLMYGLHQGQSSFEVRKGS